MLSNGKVSAYSPKAYTPYFTIIAIISVVLTYSKSQAYLVKNMQPTGGLWKLLFAKLINSTTIKYRCFYIFVLQCTAW